MRPILKNGNIAKNAEKEEKPNVNDNERRKFGDNDETNHGLEYLREYHYIVVPFASEETLKKLQKDVDMETRSFLENGRIGKKFEKNYNEKVDYSDKRKHSGDD